LKRELPLGGGVRTTAKPTGNATVDALLKLGPKEREALLFEIQEERRKQAETEPLESRRE